MASNKTPNDIKFNIEELYIQSNNEARKQNEEMKKQKFYFVRIPIINFEESAYNIWKHYFYFRSLQPQIFWIKKGTYIEI